MWLTDPVLLTDRPTASPSAAAEEEKGKRMERSGSCCSLGRKPAALRVSGQRGKEGAGERGGEGRGASEEGRRAVSYTHLRAHETEADL
eukprot:688688-Rhodomonas_salina.3